MMQTTKLRKYKNNYNQTYGRITLNEKITKSFIRSVGDGAIDILVEYDPEKDVLIIKKLEDEIMTAPIENKED